MQILPPRFGQITLEKQSVKQSWWGKYTYMSVKVSENADLQRFKDLVDPSDNTINLRFKPNQFGIDYDEFNLGKRDSAHKGRLRYSPPYASKTMWQAADVLEQLDKTLPPPGQERSEQDMRLFSYFMDAKLALARLAFHAFRSGQSAPQLLNFMLPIYTLRELTDSLRK